MINHWNLLELLRTSKTSGRNVSLGHTSPWSYCPSPLSPIITNSLKRVIFTSLLYFFVSNSLFNPCPHSTEMALAKVIKPTDLSHSVLFNLKATFYHLLCSFFLKPPFLTLRYMNALVLPLCCLLAAFTGSWTPPWVPILIHFLHSTPHLVLIPPATYPQALPLSKPIV